MPASSPGLIGRGLCTASYKVQLLGLQVHWCVWLFSPLPKAEHTLEWCQSLLGLLARCVGQEPLCSEVCQGDTLDGTDPQGWGNSAKKIGGECLH